MRAQSRKKVPAMKRSRPSRRARTTPDLEALVRLSQAPHGSISVQSGVALVIGGYAAHRGFKAFLAGLSFIHDEHRPRGFLSFNFMALLVLIAAFGLASSAMSSTGGGGSAILAIPLFFLFLWIIVAAIVQRLRDARWPVAWSLVFILGPLLLLFPGLEFIEYAGIPMALAFIVILLAPGFIRPKPIEEPVEQQ